MKFRIKNAQSGVFEIFRIFPIVGVDMKSETKMGRDCLRLCGWMVSKL